MAEQILKSCKCGSCRLIRIDKQIWAEGPRHQIGLNCPDITCNKCNTSLIKADEWKPITGAETNIIETGGPT